MSILPKNAVTPPSGRTAIQESSSVGTSGGLPVAPAGACAIASSTNDGAATATTNAPADFRNSRRDSERSMGAFITSLPSGHHALGALDRAQDRHMRAAATLQTCQRFAHLRVGRLRVLLEECGGGHDPAVHAVAALWHLLFDVSPLQRVRLLHRAEPLDGSDRLALHRGERHHTGAHRLAVEMHGTGTALREPAAEMGVVELEIVAQGVQERHVRLGVDRYRLAVDNELDGRHACSSWGDASGAAGEL